MPFGYLPPSLYYRQAECALTGSNVESSPKCMSVCHLSMLVESIRLASLKRGHKASHSEIVGRSSRSIHG